MSARPVNRDAWRSLVVEEPIDPALPIIDAHHHLWPEPPVPHLEAYGIEALKIDKRTSGHNIVATVFVEAFTRYRNEGPAKFKPLGETEYVAQVARDADREGGAAVGCCAGIVAHADMLLGADVDQVLAAHRAAAPERLRGIRHLIAHDPDYPGVLPSQPGTLQNPAFRAAFARLAAHDLSFDVWLMHPQLGELAEVAALFPETMIVLDHVGGPMGTGRYANGAGNGFEEWRRGMALVAARPNVVVKLGGLNMEFTRLGAPLDAERPWTSEEMARAQGRHILTTIDLFGPSRCMFESNFPVDRMSTGATVLWNCFKRLAERFTPAEKSALFFDTAARVYRLPTLKP
jgi:predicted TIM-barrel fold metal-dependent hydrolase